MKHERVQKHDLVTEFRDETSYGVAFAEAELELGGVLQLQIFQLK